MRDLGDEARDHLAGALGKVLTGAAKGDAVTATLVLGDLGGALAVSGLTPALHHENPMVRIYAAAALRQMGNSGTRALTAAANASGAGARESEDALDVYSRTKRTVMAQLEAAKAGDVVSVWKDEWPLSDAELNHMARELMVAGYIVSNGSRYPGGSYRGFMTWKPRVRNHPTVAVGPPVTSPTDVVTGATGDRVRSPLAQLAMVVAMVATLYGGWRLTTWLRSIPLSRDMFQSGLHAARTNGIYRLVGAVLGLGRLSADC